MAEDITTFDLTRYFFNWCFENPEKVNPNMIALYFFCIEHNNRLGWKKNFGMPSEMAKEAIGIKSYRVYMKAFNELIDFGFIILIEKSKNQFSSNIIALSKKDKAQYKARDKALDKASIKHVSKQLLSTCQSTGESKYTIDKPLTINQETNKPINHVVPAELEFMEHCKSFLNEKFLTYEFSLRAKFETWKDQGWKDGYGKPIKNWKLKIKNQIQYLKPIHNVTGKSNSAEERNSGLDDLARKSEDFIRNAGGL